MCNRCRRVGCKQKTCRPRGTTSAGSLLTPSVVIGPDFSTLKLLESRKLNRAGCDPGALESGDQTASNGPSESLPIARPLSRALIGDATLEPCRVIVCKVPALEDAFVREADQYLAGAGGDHGIRGRASKRS